jgi:phage shock protein A
LVFDRGAYELRIGVTPNNLPTEEKAMVHEGILSRMGRLIAGIAHATVEKAEGINPVAVVEQAIREIDAAAEEARADLGKARAEEHRIESRRKEIVGDIAGLDEKIRFAVSQGRDDLAKAGVARQIDLESQVAALDKALADVAERIDEGQKAMQAVIAARHDADARVAELRRSEARHASEEDGPGARHTRASRKLDKASAAVARVTGVPGGAPARAPELDELEKLSRERAIEERLARFKPKT